MEFASALSDVDAQWGKEMGVLRVNIGRTDVIEASAEEIEISRICVTWFVGHRTTAEADRGALLQVRVRLAPNDVHLIRTNSGGIFRKLRHVDATRYACVRSNACELRRVSAGDPRIAIPITTFYGFVCRCMLEFLRRRIGNPNVLQQIVDA